MSFNNGPIEAGKVGGLYQVLLPIKIHPGGYHGGWYVK
jgi:hypothetical protein